MSENGFSYSITRTLDAPVGKVWEAWTTPDQYEQWAYAAAGSVELDVRPGGAWKALMVAPDGSEFPLTGSYLEVVEHQRLVVGMDVPGVAGAAAMALDLVANGDQSEITLSQTCNTAEERDGAEQGSNMLLDGLTSLLAQA